MISEGAAAALRQALRHPGRAFPSAAAGDQPGSLAPANAADVRAEFRREFGLEEDDLLLVQIGSGFKTKGLDRSLKALAALPKVLRRRTWLIAIGQDDPQAVPATDRRPRSQRPGTDPQGSQRYPALPARRRPADPPGLQREHRYGAAGGAGLRPPVLVTDVCGYAHYIAEADAGRVLPSPFEQDSLNRLLAEMLEDAPARRLVAQWPGLRRSRRPLQHAAARRRP